MTDNVVLNATLQVPKTEKGKWTFSRGAEDLDFGVEVQRTLDGLRVNLVVSREELEAALAKEEEGSTE